MWWIYALLSALFAALTAIFAKVGIKGVNTDLATAIRTVVILVVAWLIAFFRGGLNYEYTYKAKYYFSMFIRAGYRTLLDFLF